MIAFFLGPSQSGKTLLVQETLKAASHVAYGSPVAFGEFAPEIQQRVERLRQGRPKCWTTLEPEGILEKLVDAGRGGKTHVVVLDGLSLWIGREITEKYEVYPPAMLVSHVLKEITFFLSQLAKLKLIAIVTSSEVGSGVTPVAGSARLFQECVGQVHQRCVEVADAVFLVHAGLSMAVKYPVTWCQEGCAAKRGKPALILTPEEIWKGLSDEVKIRYGRDASD